MTQIKITALLFLLSCLAQAQEADTMIVNLDEIIVRENRIQVPLSKKAAAVTLIDKWQAEILPVTNISDLLHHSAGVDIRSRGVNGIQSDLSIRGSSFDQVLLMVNGIRISDPQTGHHTMNLPFELSAIEKIEIYRGPSARIFGQNAFAGAINIITSVPDNNILKAGMSAGEYGLAEARLFASFGNIDFRNAISAGYGRSDGYKYNTDYSMGSFMYQSDIFTEKGELGLMAGVSTRSFGANGFYASPDYTDQYEGITTAFYSAVFSPKFRADWITLKVRSYYRHNNDEYIFIRTDPDYYRNLHTTGMAGIDINGAARSSHGITGAGVEITRTDISSNRLGDHKQYSASLYLDHRLVLLNNKLSLAPGVVASMFSDFSNSILPGIDIGMNISEKLMLYLNSGYTYRVPAYTDLYYEDPVNTSNPGLDPESAISNELGVKSRGVKGVYFNLGLFSRRSNNLIDRVKDSPEDKWRPENIRSVSYRGFELSTSVDFKKLIPGFIFDSRLELAYSYISTRTDGPVPAYSRFEFENLKSQLSTSLHLAYTGLFYQTFTYRYYDRVTMDNYSLFDVRTGFRGNKLGAFIDISNITDITYRETNLVEMPGRWVKIGLEYDFIKN